MRLRLSYASYLLENRPNAKIGVLFQNDDLGKDYVRGLKRKLGQNAQSMIVAEEAFDVSEPSIDSHLVKLKATGAYVLLDIATPKFAAQAIKRVAEIGWRPLHLLSYVSASIGSVIKPAGLENAQGIISAATLRIRTILNGRTTPDSGSSAHSLTSISQPPTEATH